MIRPCIRCGRNTRPAGSTLDHFPGTISRSGGRMCSTCYAQDYRKGHTRPTEKTARALAFGDCVRCGVERAAASHPLCRDCRGVLTKDEVKLWAA